MAAETIYSVEFSEALSALGLAVAIWAGVTAEPARRWQRDRDHERAETRLRVLFEHSAEEIGPFVVVLGDQDPRPPPPMSYMLTLVVVNEGHSTEWVSSMSVSEAKPPADGESIWGFDLTEPFAKGDREVRPRERLTTMVAAEEVVGFDLAAGFVGVVRLASGAEFRSDAEHLWEDIQQTVDERNREAR